MSPSPQLTRSRVTTRPVQQVIASRAVIDQAKGVLIHRFRVDAEGAFKLLRQWAAETSTTPQVVAQTLVHGVCLQDTTRSWDPFVLSFVAAELEEFTEDQSGRVPRPRPRWID